MNKNILIKLAVVLLVAVLIHSVFWFFKTGQLEKHINNYIAENSANVSASEVSVSGFPFNQKVTIRDLKFTIPNPAFSKYQTIVKHLEATSGIFSNDFSVQLLDKVAVQDADNNVGTVEFTKDPQINFVIQNGLISHLAYQDFGYHVLDVDRNVVYGAASTNLTLDSSMDVNEQITSRLLLNVKEIENFGLADAYKNSSEKRIIDAIKTGEISIGTASTDVLAVNPAAAPTLAAQVAATLDPTKNQPAAAVPPVAPATAPVASVEAVVNNVVANNEPIKSNLMIDFEYVLTPSRAEQQANVPLDPTHMQEAVQYNKALKINNLEFSNALYKIVVNGQVNSFQDDNMPSGFITIRVDNIANFTDYVVTSFNQMSDQKPTMPEVQTSELAAQTTAPQNAYQNFLKKIATGFPAISQELAAKNQLSKDNVAVFDVRREKNLEFVINETPLREIMGKF